MPHYMHVFVSKHTLCHLEFGMEAQLDGCLHIAVETLQLMANIYIFIISF